MDIDSFGNQYCFTTEGLRCVPGVGTEQYGLYFLKYIYISVDTQAPKDIWNSNFKF